MVRAASEVFFDFMGGVWGAKAPQKQFVILGVLPFDFYQKYRLLLSRKYFQSITQLSFCQNRDTQ